MCFFFCTSEGEDYRQETAFMSSPTNWETVWVIPVSFTVVFFSLSVICLSSLPLSILFFCMFPSSTCSLPVCSLPVCSLPLPAPFLCLLPSSICLLPLSAPFLYLPPSSVCFLPLTAPFLCLERRSSLCSIRLSGGVGGKQKAHFRVVYVLGSSCGE